MVIKVGIIGLSEGNGHPYSFSSIINGFNSSTFNKVEWPGIYNYLSSKNPLEIGIEGMQVVAAWTQSLDETKKICASGSIHTACVTPEEMQDLVDAVIIARDDWETHYPIANKFLESGKYVFIDKPLTLSEDELAYFIPYLKSGKLMSCGALRYARELDNIRIHPSLTETKFVTATVLNDWKKYGIHMLDAIFSFNSFSPDQVTSVTATGSHTFLLKFVDQREVLVNCIGDKAIVFNITIYNCDAVSSFDISDNFTAFKRTLLSFKEMILSGKPAIDPMVTEKIIRILIAGQKSKQLGTEVSL